MNENNFTTGVWCALIEEITPLAEEMAYCVRGYHVYKDTWAAAIGEVLVHSREQTNAGKIFFVKLYHTHSNLRPPFSPIRFSYKYGGGGGGL